MATKGWSFGGSWAQPTKVAAVLLAASAMGLGACAASADGESGDDTDEQSLAAKPLWGGCANVRGGEGYECVDDPHDDCDPNAGGADCGGMCVKSKKPKKGACGSDPTKTYVSTSLEECALIKYACAEGVPFSDACGCGCQTSAGEPCGVNTCADGEYCCNASCGTCVPMGYLCTQQVCTSN